MCAGGGTFAGVPTAETRGCPMQIAWGWGGSGGGGGGGGLIDFAVEVPAAEPLVWPVIGPWGTETSPVLTLVMSWILDRLLSLLIEVKRM